MEDIIQYFNENSWNDFLLDKILIDYSNIYVHMLTPKDSLLQIQCCNFIGINYIGQWDENIIKDIHISRDSCLIDNALKKIGKNNSINHKGGGTREYNACWYDVSIELIDKICIHIICQTVQLEQGGN